MGTQPVVGELDRIATDARRRIESAPDKETLEELRVELLGKKGVVTGALRGVGVLPADQRAAAGARANAVKTEIDQQLVLERQAFDARMPEIESVLRGGDLVVITADHGCDPTWHGTDHTREKVPILAFGPFKPSGSIGCRETFADVAATVSSSLGLAPTSAGTSFAV